MVKSLVPDFVICLQNGLGVNKAGSEILSRLVLGSGEIARSLWVRGSGTDMVKSGRRDLTFLSLLSQQWVNPYPFPGPVSLGQFPYFPTQSLYSILRPDQVQGLDVSYQFLHMIHSIQIHIQPANAVSDVIPNYCHLVLK